MVIYSAFTAIYLLDLIVFMIYPYLGYPINGLSLYREVNISVFLSSDV